MKLPVLKERVIVSNNCLIFALLCCIAPMSLPGQFIPIVGFFTVIVEK
jgi:hypothetical protein